MEYSLFQCALARGRDANTVHIKLSRPASAAEPVLGDQSDNKTRTRIVIIEVLH